MSNVKFSRFGLSKIMNFQNLNCQIFNFEVLGYVKYYIFKIYTIPNTEFVRFGLLKILNFQDFIMPNNEFSRFGLCQILNFKIWTLSNNEL